MTTKQVDYAELLASAKTKCPMCKGKGNVEERAYPPGQAVTTCPNCEGTGLAYLLPDSVRVKCDWVIPDGTRLVPHHGMWCCGGPGFTVLDPVAGGDTWMTALAHAGLHFVLGSHIKGGGFWASIHNRAFISADTPLETLLQSAWEAVVAAGMLKEETP